MQQQQQLLGGLLAEMAGEQGDIHMQDLATVLSKNARAAAAGQSNTKQLK
eukprot:SAG31_NODE_14922_length_780_cov_1.472834_1_plen_49_part_10